MTTKNMNNENKPRNNLVAESDLQGALKGIQSCLQDPKFTALQQNDENGPEVLTSLLEKAQESLTSHVERLVEPLSDKAYHEHLQRNVVEDDGDEDSMDEESEEEPISDDEYDEEELVDQEVLQRARVLRQQVREASERVGKLRSSVTDRAVSVAQREAALLVGPAPTNPLKPYNAKETARRLEQPFSGNKSEKLVEMEESLKSLTTSLKEMDNRVPDTMETLQETIDTIQTAMEEGTSQSLSQTERAIRSRSNEGPSMSQEGGNTAADARLGSFLGQH